MLYICGLYSDGVLYVLDERTYTTLAGAEKRRQKLGEGWRVFKVDEFTLVKETGE